MSTATQITSNLSNGESSTIAQGTVVRVGSVNNTARKAQADAPANVEGILGVAMVGANPAVQFQAALLGDVSTLMETGLTLAAGQAVYVSPTVAGRATNVAPGSNVTPLGWIKNVNGYSVNQRVTVTVTALQQRVSGGGGALLTDYEVINNPAANPHPLDPTVGHHILLTANFPFQPAVLAAGTGSEFHTFFNGNDQTDPGGGINQYLRLLPAYVIPETGVVSAPGAAIQVEAGTGYAAQWDSDANAWVVKIIANRNPVPLVNRLRDQLQASVPYDDPNQFGTNMVAMSVTTDPAWDAFYFGQNNLKYALGLAGLQGLLTSKPDPANRIEGDCTRSIANGSTIVCNVLAANSTVTLDPTGMTTDQVIQVVMMSIDGFTLACNNGGPGAGTMHTFSGAKAQKALFKFNGTDLERFYLGDVNPRVGGWPNP